ncbi:MAG: hypothetical protein V9H69_10740 [Anaerolineae bacterium]
MDSELGALLSGFSYTLSPGASAFITETDDHQRHHGQHSHLDGL